MEKTIKELRKKIKALKLDSWCEGMALKKLDKVEYYIHIGLERENQK